jgi:hypothetical protein
VHGYDVALPAGLPVWDPVGTRLEDLVRSSGGVAACLVEDPHGRVVCHAVGEQVPAAVHAAVVSRSSSALHRTASGLRSVGRQPGGPVLSGRLEGWSGQVTIAPLIGAGHLWLLSEAPIGATSLIALTADLSALLHRMHGEATEPGLYDRLHGHGADVAAVDSWVAVVRAEDRRGLEPVAVHRALSAAMVACPAIEVTATHGHAFVLLRASAEAGAAAAVTQAVRKASRDLDVPLVAAVAPATAGLVRARECAERALSAHAVAGRCTTVAEAGSHETLQRVLDTVRALPALGEDPLADLLEAGDPLVSALRAWLDSHGDVPVAATREGVHVNTMRYRLKRALALVPLDLDDPIARLDVHLRLLSRD